MKGPRFVLSALILLLLSAPVVAIAQTVGNPACPGEDVFFNPGHGEDIFVPPGYRVEVFATGLNFPAGIAFKGNKHRFEVYVTESGTGLPGRCNAAVGFPSPDATNPFLPQVRVLDHNGLTLRVLGRAPTVAAREAPAYLHAPTIGIAFEREFEGGRLFVSDSLQGVRGAQGPKNSSRILQVNGSSGVLTELVTGLPTGDHPTEQLTVRSGFLYWSQGSVTNSGVVGLDNTGGVTGPDTTGRFQHEIPCENVVLSGNNFDSGDGSPTAAFKPHGISGVAGEIVPAFTGATQAGMCSGAILRARLDQPQRSVEPYSWGYRNPFGLRFAPHDHPLKGALLITENGEDERGARPVNNSPDRLHVTRGGVDFHGWPDRFGFLASTQAVFNPIGGPAADCPACAADKPVLPTLLFPPKPPVAPLALEAANVAAVGLDFTPSAFAGGGNPGDHVKKGDALVTREGDFGFSPANGDPEEGHDIQRVHFLKDGRLTLDRFAFNCKAQNQQVIAGRKMCTEPEEQAFVAQIRGINRPVDGKFGPDGAFYLVDFGAVRDVGVSNPDSMFKVGADAPLVQIPGTGVIWKISRVASPNDRNDDHDGDWDKDRN